MGKVYLAAALTAFVLACGGPRAAATSTGSDGGVTDGGDVDGGDAGEPDAGAADAGGSDAGGSDAGGPDAGPLSDGGFPIEHVIVLVKENHTFDNYFGSFPGAEGTGTYRLSD